MADTDRQPGWWSRLDILAKSLGSVFVPLVVLLIGQGFNANQRKLNDDQMAVQRQAEAERLTQQAVAEEARQQADRLTLLLGYLGSPDARQRLLAIKVAEHYAAARQLPTEIVPILVEIAQTGTPQEATAATATLQALPALVYIHIQSEQQRDTARSMQAALEGSGVSVPGIQRVSTGPTQAELRYFRTVDEREAESIVQVLRGAGYPVTPKDLTHEYSARASQLARHFEVWFGSANP